MARLRLSHPHKMMKVGYSCKNAKDGDPKGFKWIYQMASVSNSVVQSPKLAQGEEAEELKNQECGPEAACCMGHVQGFGKQRETRVLFHENIRK